MKLKWSRSARAMRVALGLLCVSLFGGIACSTAPEPQPAPSETSRPIKPATFAKVKVDEVAGQKVQIAYNAAGREVSRLVAEVIAGKDRVTITVGTGTSKKVETSTVDLVANTYSVTLQRPGVANVTYNDVAHLDAVMTERMKADLAAMAPFEKAWDLQGLPHVVNRPTTASGDVPYDLSACNICLAACNLIPWPAGRAACIVACNAAACTDNNDAKQTACNSDCLLSCHAAGFWDSKISTCTCYGQYICNGSTTGPCCDPCYYNPTNCGCKSSSSSGTTSQAASAAADTSSCCADGTTDQGCGCGNPAPDPCCDGETDQGCGCGNPAPGACGCDLNVTDQGCGCNEPPPGPCGCSGNGVTDQGCGCGNPPPNSCGSCDGSVSDQGCGCGKPPPNSCGSCDGSVTDQGCGCGKPPANSCGSCDGSVTDQGCGCGNPPPNSCGCNPSVTDQGCGCGVACPCGSPGVTDQGCGCGNPPPNGCGSCDGSVIDQGCGCGNPPPTSCGCTGQVDEGCGCGNGPPPCGGGCGTGCGTGCGGGCGTGCGELIELGATKGRHAPVLRR